MRKPSLMLSLLAFVLAISGCVKHGLVCPAPPRLPPVPASLMQPPTTGTQVRAELFEPQTTPTPKSGDSKPSSTPSGK